jgi:hypothetical protein
MPGWTGKQEEGGSMEALWLIVLFALFLLSGQRRRLFGGSKDAKQIDFRGFIWR